MRWFLALTFCIFLLVGCVQEPHVVVDNGQETIKITVEIAQTLDERRQGLMHRETLDYNSGMYFIFPDEDIRSFWMKNTLIPLDIIFISAKGRVVDIHSAVPCEEDPCRSYVSADKAQYVLEVNQGFALREGIKIGSTIELKP